MKCQTIQTASKVANFQHSKSKVQGGSDLVHLFEIGTNGTKLKILSETAQPLSRV